MKIILLLRRWLVIGLILTGCLIAAPQPAHAVDPTLQKLISIVATALGEPALNDALPMIDCIIKLGPAKCTNVKSLAESEGKKAVKQFVPNDPLIQSAVDIIKAAYAEDWIKVLELTGTDILLQVACKVVLSGSGPVKGFICGSMFKEVSYLAKPVLKKVLVTVKNPTPDNLLGLITVIDPELACKVVPNFSGKDDICGLIKDILEIAKKVLNSAEAVAEFLGDLGEGVANLAEDAWCETGGALLGSCDDSGPPPKPKSQVIYEKFFAQKVMPDGLAAIEADDDLAFIKLKSKIGDEAKAKGYAKIDILLAASIFTKAVDAQWTADILNKVLQELTSARDFYNTNHIYTEAKNAWNQYKDHKKMPLPDTILRCKEHFYKGGFKHVDRWITGHNEAQQFKVQSMYEWCEKSFWEGNKGKFAQYFKKFMEPVCPGLGCSSKSDLEFCQPIMKSFGLTCVVTVSSKQPQPTVGAPALTLPLGKSSPESGQTADKPQIEIKQPPLAITDKPLPIDGKVKRTSPNALPDITSAAQIMIGSVSTQWGATVNVDDKQAFSAQNGVCQFTVQHTTRNIGLASTGAFDSIWTNSNAHGSWSRVWGSIASGGQGTQKDMVMLKPGMNILNLKLDNPLKVQESNENNNQFRVIVNLSGACGAASRIAPPSADRLKTPANPRLPVTPERASDPVLRR
jgi:hypothetical protein